MIGDSGMTCDGLSRFEESPTLQQSKTIVCSVSKVFMITKYTNVKLGYDGSFNLNEVEKMEQLRLWCFEVVSPHLNLSLLFIKEQSMKS